MFKFEFTEKEIATMAKINALIDLQGELRVHNYIKGVELTEDDKEFYKLQREIDALYASIG